MLIGEQHIRKAYLGLTELDPDSAFVGTEPLIDRTE